MSLKGLNTGVSGLQSQSKKMEVIGNNLANINTVGFKKSTVSFQEAFYDVMNNASAGDGQNLGGTNSAEVGSGVNIGAITNIFTQGNQLATGRTLDFMIEGDDFFVAKNGSDESLMLTRNGSFALDGDGFVVDSLGNKVLGFNVNPETNTVDDIAQAMQIPSTAIPPNATSEVDLSANIDSSITERLADSSTHAWELFSGGENFGKMSISSAGVAGLRDVYGSGFYQESVNYTESAASIDGPLQVITLPASPANRIEGFRAGDSVSLLQGGNQSKSTIASVDTVARTITLSNPLPGTFSSAATLSVTNLSNGGSSQGSSGSSIHNDILGSQISMVDDNGRLLANFYRVHADPAKYTRGTASIAGGGSLTTGMGEFTSMQELKELIEVSLRDTQLTNYVASTDLDVSLDKFGGISFGGTGLVQSFRFVMNADNTEMLDRFSGLAITDDGAVATTQARIDANGEVIAPPALGLGNRTTHSSKMWYSTVGLPNYGYSANNSATEYGEYAGLRIDAGANGDGFGGLLLSSTNALGETVSREFHLVARNADSSQGEFSTMGELAMLMQNTLRSEDFSTVAESGSLIADQTASASFNNGRLSFSTVSGIFQDLKLEAVNTTVANVSGVDRSDDLNFGTVLGELRDGINGKSGMSNQFIQSDMTSQMRVYDSQGNEHTAVTYFVRDRSSGLNNIEWKFKISSNPNVNTFASEETESSSTYGNTFNSIQDTFNSRGVLAFDIESGKVLEGGDAGSDSRYVSEGNLKMLPSIHSQEADSLDIAFDFSKVTSFNGQNTIVGKNVDGYALGKLIRLTSTNNTGEIHGVYSNGKVQALAKIGLMNISNAEGLEKIGSSYFLQTANSSSSGGSKGIDQIFAVGNMAHMSGDSVYSKVHGNALEASNVDLTEELTEMITTQRSYSASGKIITTSDEMLQEALNLKR